MTGVRRSMSAGRHTYVPEDASYFIDVTFGAFCSIASGLRIVSGQHACVDHPCVSTFAFDRWGDYPPGRDTGTVTVGSDVWVCETVTILEGVTVGHGAILAAGAVVTKNVPPYAVVAGNPATVRKTRFPPDTVARLLRIAWWDWPDDRIRDQLPLMADVARFIEAQ